MANQPAELLKHICKTHLHINVLPSNLNTNRAEQLKIKSYKLYGNFFNQNNVKDRDIYRKLKIFFTEINMPNLSFSQSHAHLNLEGLDNKATRLLSDSIGNYLDKIVKNKKPIIRQRKRNLLIEINAADNVARPNPNAEMSAEQDSLMKPNELEDIAPILNTIDDNLERIDLPNIGNLNISEQISLEPEKLPENISLIQISMNSNIENNEWFGVNIQDLLPKPIPLIDGFERITNIVISPPKPMKPIRKRKIQRYSLSSPILKRLPVREIGVEDVAVEETAVQHNPNLKDTIDWDFYRIDKIEDLENITTQDIDHITVQNVDLITMPDVHHIIIPDVDQIKECSKSDNENIENTTTNEFIVRGDNASMCPIRGLSPIPIDGVNNTNNSFNESDTSTQSGSSSLFENILTLSETVGSNNNKSGTDNGIIPLKSISAHSSVLYCAMTKRYINMQADLECGQLEQINLKANPKDIITENILE